SGLPGTGAADALLDDEGFLWVATQNRGVFRSRNPLTEDRLESLRTVPDAEFGREVSEPFFEPLWNVSTGAPTNGMRNLLSTDGRVWVGTVEGLAVFDIGASEPTAIINRESGLGGEMIMGSAIDPSGDSLWVSQNAGIARINIDSMAVTSIITVGDGLLDNEAWAYSSLRIGSDGTVYLSTPKGLSLYRPWLDSPSLSRPLLKIDRAHIDQDISGHRESLFEFAPLTFVNESDVVYRTRLLGYDEGWSDATGEARIRYTNLPAFGLPRPYTLEVMAKSGDGVWTDPRQFRFRALPPWWARWWALLGWITLFVAVLITYNRFRTFSLARQNVRLEETVKERTSEIAAQAMEIDTLDRIVQIINQEVEFEKVLHALLEQGMVLFAEAERGGTLIYDHERGTMTIPTAIGYAPEVLSKIRLSAADARRRYETGGTRIGEGIYLLRSLGDLPGVTDVEGVPIPRSMLAMTIIVDDRVEAFLVFENFERENAFQGVSLRTARRYREHARTAVAKALILRELELRNREAQRANEAKSTFLANMSHELRTPLNSIIGFSELLVEKLGGSIAERHRHFLRLILTSGQHLLAIINDILDLSKVEAGKMQLFPELFDPKSAIEGVQQVMRPVAAKKNVSIDVVVEPDTPSIESDPGKFKQILYNLVSNAVKFSSAGSTVRVYCRPQGDMISVAVEDEGIGIASDQLETIFDEFKQIESNMSRRFEGTGLGLSLVRRFVDFLGGQISVESELGRGSTFTFRIPVVLPAKLRREETRQTSDSPANHPRGRVLVVEDDHSSWELIRSALLESDLSPIRATNGEEALRLVRTVRPDAITLDISLPGQMSGWDVLKEIKSEPVSSDIPVVIVSHSHDHELGIALGADDYLVKPIGAEQLNERIVALVALKRSNRVHRLLLIDDDQNVHQILGGFLKDAGYEVVSALSGREGIKLAIDAHPDAIILDLILPDLSGFQVAETLRQLGETSRIPVIVLTSRELNHSEQATLESHLEKIVRKGTGTRPALLDAIERVLPKASTGTADSL
ncbi:MAG: response regulator, partial [Acidobacteria bacterium]|nr:response regulator [Acidobacteriota bacterium]